MSEHQRKLLQELAFYTDLLKKHERNPNERTNIHSLPKSAQNAACKPHSFNANNSSLGSAIKLSQMSPNNLVKRTVLINQSKHLTDTSAPCSQMIRSVKVSQNKSSSLKNSSDSVKNPFVNSSIVTSNSNTKSSESEELLKEIVFLTNLMKNSSETSLSACANKNVTVGKGLINKAYPNKSTVGSFQRNNKIVNNSSSNLPKQNSQFLNSGKRMFLNSKLSEPLSNNKYCFKKIAVQNVTLIPKNAFKLDNNKTTALNQNSKRSLISASTLCCNEKIEKQDPKNLKDNPSLRKIQTRTKFSSVKVPSNYKLMKLSISPKTESSFAKSKSPTSLKSSIKRSVFATTSHDNYSKRTIIYSKNKFTQKASPKLQRHKKLNGMYKIVNKANVQNSKTTWKRKSLEKSVLNETNSSIELLESSELDRLEEQLLAISGSSPDTVEPSRNKTLVGSPSGIRKSSIRTPKQKMLASKYKIVNQSANHRTSKLILKKSPVKKLKLMSSKYKVVNKNLCSPKRACSPIKTSVANSARKISKKVVLTKFSIVNKHTPMLNPSSVLVKRLYKSKSTLINKNETPTSYSAKLIKSKYLRVKRKSTFQNQYLQPKILSKMQCNGLYAGSRKHCNMYQYATQLGNTRRYVKKISDISYKKHCRKTILTSKKGNNVLTIRGSRFSISSSGRKIRRLPMKGQLSTQTTPKRLFVSRKAFVRTPENSIKASSSPSFHVANRVLHRSISRVLTASTKKSLSKVNTYCMFYNRFGRCNRGVKCTYIHDPSKIAVCTRFLRGTCKIDGCPFSHEVTPGKMAICSFFLVGACDKDKCPYRHESLSPNAVLCKAFVQGYCPKGKECNKAHILICPKFILGECVKGSSCAYPHPRQKAKRAVPKDTADGKVVPPSEVKENDNFLEKVARYFQAEESSESCAVEKKDFKISVVRRRKLEEQPAFIPLSNTPSKEDSSEKL